MNGIKHINVRTFREALSDQLLGLEDFEVVGLGHVHGTAKGMESPFVFYLKNTDWFGTYHIRSVTRRVKNMYLKFGG